MKVEDEFVRYLQDCIRVERDKVVEKKEKTIEEKDKEIAELKRLYGVKIKMFFKSPPLLPFVPTAERPRPLF